MKRGIVYIVFGLALCWVVSAYMNLNVVSFHIAGVGITRTMLCALMGVGLCAWLVRGR